MKPNLRLKSTVLRIVENQIRNNNPPETKETLQRLMKIGDSRQEAIRKIAVVMVEEMYDVMKNREAFNQERFVNKLRELN